jgi:hypothetical protein
MQHLHITRFRRTATAATVAAPAGPAERPADLPRAHRRACVPDRRLPSACPAGRVGGPATARRGAAVTPRGAQ